MNKVSLNDWQTMQARKEIEELHKKYSLSDTIDITVMMEVLLLVIGFFLDNVFKNQAGNISQNAGEVGTTIWLVFAILSIFTVVVIWTIRFFYVRSKRALKKKIKTKKEISDLIDNKLCYYLMTADSFDVRDIGVSEDGEPTIIDDVEKFYLIEKSYYVNKCVMILMSISNNCRNAIVIGETPMEYLSGKISSSRMKNIVTILDNIYAELSEKFKICITADESIEKIFYENSYYRARLNEFKSELDRIIKELSN